MVGRTTAGDPIVRMRPEPIEGIATDPETVWENQFTYESDPEGIACPFGAHIRRANPRNADLPSDARRLLRRIVRVLGFGSRGPRDDLLSSTRFHRILRRGREYGPRILVDDILGGASRDGDGAERGMSETELNAERGLRFICLNANISRQFEFIQTAWIENPKFDGLDERDPSAGWARTNFDRLGDGHIYTAAGQRSEQAHHRLSRFHHGARRCLFLHARYLGDSVHKPDQLNISSPVGSMCGVLFIRWRRLRSSKYIRLRARL